MVEHIDLLRQVFRKVKKVHPFEIDATVVLPDHLHCIWTLPPGDADYKTRWALSRRDFPVTYHPEKNVPEVAGKEVSVESGNADIGSIWSGITGITNGTSTISIGTR